MEFLEDDLILKSYLGYIEDELIISKINDDGIITYVNDRFSQISGYTKEELIGKSHEMLRSSRVPLSVYENIWKIVRDGHVYSGVLRSKAKDGSIYIADIKIFPLISDNGINEYLSIRTDITKYVTQKEKQILDASEKLKIVINSKGSIVDFNQHAAKVFGTLSVGATFHECIRLNDTKIDTIISSMLVGGYLVTNEPVTFDGKTYLLKSEKLTEDYILSFKDITNIQNLKEEHYKDLEESKDKMLVVFTHELKTPLNGIIGFSEILTKRLTRGLKKGVKEKDINKYIELSEDINALGNILYTSINSLLDSARIKEGKYEVKKTSFELSKSLEGFLSLYSRIYNKSPICEFEEFRIYSDLQSIEHIFTNLFSNALKYGNSEIYITLKQIDGRFELKIEDDGDGIKEDDKKRIFNMFDQLDEQELTREVQGTGIGLYLVKQLCNILDYDIDIQQSKKLGGASFAVSGKIN